MKKQPDESINTTQKKKDTSSTWHESSGLWSPGCLFVVVLIAAVVHLLMLIQYSAHYSYTSSSSSSSSSSLGASSKRASQTRHPRHGGRDAGARSGIGCAMSAYAVAAGIGIASPKTIVSSICGGEDEPLPDVMKPAVFLYAGNDAASTTTVIHNVESAMEKMTRTQRGADGGDSCVCVLDASQIHSQQQMSDTLRRCENGGIVTIVRSVESVSLKGAKVLLPMMSEAGQLEDEGRALSVTESSVLLLLESTIESVSASQGRGGRETATEVEIERDAKARLERSLLATFKADGALEEEARAIVRALRRRIDHVVVTTSHVVQSNDNL